MATKVVKMMHCLVCQCVWLRRMITAFILLDDNHRVLFSVSVMVTVRIEFGFFVSY